MTNTCKMNDSHQLELYFRFIVIFFLHSDMENYMQTWLKVLKLQVSLLQWHVWLLSPLC